MNGPSSSTKVLKIALIADEISQTFALKSLRELGIHQVQSYQQASNGFNAILDGSFDGVLIAWELPNGSSGTSLLSRIRRLPEFSNLPIVMIVESKRKSEIPLVQEYPCTAFVVSPVKTEDLKFAFESVHKEQDWLNANILKIKKTLESIPMNPEHSAQLLVQLLQSSPNPAPTGLIASKVLAEHNKHGQALAILKYVLGREPRNLQALSARAQLHYVLGQSKEALSTLQLAFTIAPKNIDRISLMGEIEVSLRRPEQAIKNFQDALGLDQHYVWSKVGLTVAQSMHNNSTLLSAFTNEDPSVAKVINNLGVVLARHGEFEKAIKYYLMSFGYLASEDLQAKVSFNMGLGFMKWGKDAQARYWLEKAHSISHGSFLKAAHFLKNLKNVKAAAGLTETQTIHYKNGPAAPKISRQVEMSPVITASTPIRETRPESSFQPVKPTPPVASDSILLLEEENTGLMPPKKRSGIQNLQGSLDRMIDEIDKNLRIEPLKKAE